MSKIEEVTLKTARVEELKAIFAQHLRDVDNLKRPEGIPTGLASLDRFLFWKGLPKAALSLFSGELGSGPTSLWIEAAAEITRANRWVAWIDGDVPLAPLSLYHKGMNLERFIVVPMPETGAKLLWVLQELMSSSLFDLIGCDLGSQRLREHQVRKLQTRAREAQVALVFLSRLAAPRGALASLYSLILSFEKRLLRVERALHRPTPHDFPRSVHYARFTFHTGDRIGLGADLAPNRHIAQPEPSSLPEAARATGAGF